MANAQPTSGSGTRPTTSGGVDNIGAGESFSAKKTKAGEKASAPMPPQHMPAKNTVETTRKDDSAAFNLHENPKPVSNNDKA